MSNAEIRLYRELCRLLEAIPRYHIPDNRSDNVNDAAEASIVGHPIFSVRDATELLRTIPSELRAYLCIPYERLLEIFRLVNECQQHAERTVTKMMEVGDTLDIEADSPKLEELAFKLRNGRAFADGADDNGGTSRWEERYQQKRMASYCFAGVVMGVILAFGLAVAHEKLKQPAYATEIEVATPNGLQKIGLQSTQVYGLPPDGVHPRAFDSVSIDVHEDGQYAYTMTLERKNRK